MGRRGPKPDPIQVVQAKGNPGKRRLGSAPTGSALKGNAPPWFPPEAKREWRRLKAILEPKGLLLEKYRGNFEMLCLDYGLWFRCARLFCEDGLTYTKHVITKQGTEWDEEVLRPEVARADKYQASYYRRGASFGLTPSDDGALGFPPGREEDPMDGALAG